MSTRDQNRFNQLLIQFLNDVNRRVDDCFANISAASSGGTTGSWVLDSNTWTFSSADAPIYVVSVNADVTGTISVGMRIRLVHGAATKYFIVHAVGAFSAGATLLTLYGGTTYTLSATAITSTYYSSAKVPFAFPASPDLWTVSLLDTTQAIDNAPATSTWINLGPDGGTAALQISIPIGSWRVQYSVVEQIVITLAVVTSVGMRFTLSTANNSESDPQFSSIVSLPLSIGTDTANLSFFKEKLLVLTSKTTYFLNVFLSASAAGATSVSLRGDALTTTVKAICAYL